MGPVGTHDVVVTGSGIVWSDSFGMNSRGNTSTENATSVQRLEVDGARALVSPPIHFNRGLARNRKALVVGGSCNAKRSQRFNGQADLYVYLVEEPKFDWNGALGTIKMPSSQIYQVCNSSGSRFHDECPDDRLIDIIEILNSTLGQPVAQFPTES